MEFVAIIVQTIIALCFSMLWANERVKNVHFKSENDYYRAREKKQVFDGLLRGGMLSTKGGNLSHSDSNSLKKSHDDLRPKK